MTDYLIKLRKNSLANRAVKSLGLPIPLPQELKREVSGWRVGLLESHSVVVNARSEVTEKVAQAYAKLGAKFYYEQEFLPTEGQKVGTLIYDLTDASDLDELDKLFKYFSALSGTLAANGRIIILCAASDRDPIRTTILHAASGFLRSLAKEVGRAGCTANMIEVANGAGARVGPVACFISSPLSAYVSGQIFRVNGLVKDVVSNNESDSADGLISSKLLHGRAALVTGAARGIGYAVATSLAKEGATVVCLDVEGTQESLERLANYVSGVALPVNVNAYDSYEKVMQALPSKFSGYDIVVHNAGITRDKTLRKMSHEQWDQVTDVNLRSVINLTDRMRENGLNDDCRLTMLSSTSAISGNFGQTNYATSKAGLIGYTKALAPTLAERGIAINAVAPGFIETKMTAAMPLMIREFGRRFNALGQAGRPSDVADVITFLSSKNSLGLTGQVIRVCGLNYLGA